MLKKIAKYKKKILKWGLSVLITPFVLIFILAILIYIPPVQNWLVSRVASYASESTGMNISIDYVKLVFPLDLGVDGIHVLKPDKNNSAHNDTIADIDRLTVDVQLLPLLRSQVEIDELDFKDVKLNTVDFIDNLRVKGTLNRLKLESHGINLKDETVKINSALLSSVKIDVALSDSVPTDTTTSENFWKISLDNLHIADADVTVRMPGDTLQFNAYLGNTKVQNGFFDLHEEIYSISRLDWLKGRLAYDNNFEPHVKQGLDFNHVALSDVNIGIDSLYYHKSDLNLNLRQCSFLEKSGFKIDEITANVTLDSTKVAIPSFRMRTPESSFSANLFMTLAPSISQSAGLMKSSVDASIGKRDIMRFLSGMPASFVRDWPNYPLSIKGVVNGNMKKADISGLIVKLPTAFNMKCSGSLSDLTNISTLKARLALKANTYDLRFVSSYLQTDQITIPSGISLDGLLRINRQKYDATMKLSEGHGTMLAKAGMNFADKSYYVHVDANKLPLQHFIINQGLKPFSGDFDVAGKGFEFRSPNARMTARAKASDLHVSGYNLSGMQMSADLANGKARASLDSHNPLLDGKIDLNAIIGKKDIQAILSCDLQKADLYGWGVFQKPFIASLRAGLDISTNFHDSHKLQGHISDIYFQDTLKTYHPENIVMDAFTQRDSTYAHFESGDFNMRLKAGTGIKSIISHSNGFMTELKRQLADHYIDQIRLRSYLPDMQLHFAAGSANFLTRTLYHFGYYFKNVHVDMDTSMQTGINGDLNIDSLVVSGIQLDTIRLAVNSDSVRTDFTGRIRNNKKNPQYVFNAMFRGAFYERGLYFGTRVYDANEQLGVSLGLQAAMTDHGLQLRLGGKDSPVLGYKQFHVNKDNYLLFGDNRHVSANIKLYADDGMGVRVHTNDSTEALQDLTVGLTKFELSKILSVIPYTPDISGVMDGDFHIVKTADDLSVSSYVAIDNMVYEGCPMGDMSTEFVYMPKEGGSHYVDGTLSCNDIEIGTLSGTYDSANDNISADLSLSHTPLLMLNGFIPDRLFYFKGYADGTVSVNGSLSQPDITGEMRMDSAYIASDPYGVELRFDNTPVKVSHSHMQFDSFNMYANNKSPLSITGYFDFSDFNSMYLDMVVRATNYLLIDSKENPRSEAYGKAYVNFYSRMRGNLENLSVRGKLDVLGSTDMTYILRDSPLTTDNQMDELVKFVDFRDTHEDRVVTRPTPAGLDMDLSISIDEGAHIVCALNTDHSNYVDLIGGGDLRMQYNAADNLRLTGRYTLSNGEMKYSLPVIPLKTFKIQDGSYIEFWGDAMNPKLNITALEEVKTTVSNDGGVGRSVLFNCGVEITQTLNNMGLQFIIDAPEDMSIHNELQTMSVENRGKLAVTMLTTGMYLANGNTNQFSMNSALSAFLNSQINSISGSALRTLDLSFGMDNTTLGTGEVQTDYSFKFAKRFWNNRLNIVVGGKVSTGADVANQNNSFFDNVTFEYRLSQNSNQYLKLFYERDSYDWLEGNVGKYGGGFMWRRKLQHFRDIFRFKTKRQPLASAPTTLIPKTTPDTVNVKNNETDR